MKSTMLRTILTVQRPIFRRNWTITIRNSCNTDSGKNIGFIVGLYKNERDINKPILTVSGQEINKQSNGKLMNLIGHFGLVGEVGTAQVFTDLLASIKSVAVVGLGSKGIGLNRLEGIQTDMENARHAAAIGIRELEQRQCDIIRVDPMDQALAVGEGSGLAVWRYQDNKMLEKQIPEPKLELYGTDHIDRWKRGLFYANSQNLARHLSESPPNQMTPRAFAQATVDSLCACGVNVEVRDKDWIELNNFSSILTVAKSSYERPYFVEMNYFGTGVTEKPVLLIGSGLTFNSGGLHLNDLTEMINQKAAMAGASCVVAVIRAIASLKLPINVSGIIPLAENMPSGNACRPGDVIQSLNGKSIAIHDTRNAGALMLADALVYGQRNWSPRIIITLGNLSNGVQSALGSSATGGFSNCTNIWDEMEKAGVVTGDRVWRLPMWKHFTKKVTDYTDVDVSNTGTGGGGPCLAAAFLKEFIETDEKWVHLDLSGVKWSEGKQGYPYFNENNMTGRPVRTLIQFLSQLTCKKEVVVKEDCKKN